MTTATARDPSDGAPAANDAVCVVCGRGGWPAIDGPWADDGALFAGPAGPVHEDCAAVAGAALAAVAVAARAAGWERFHADPPRWCWAEDEEDLAARAPEEVEALLEAAVAAVASILARLEDDLLRPQAD